MWPPYEKKCEGSDCLISEKGNQICQTMWVEYKMVCMTSEEFHLGETVKPLDNRIAEYLRGPCHPQSYSDNPFLRYCSHSCTGSSQRPRAQIDRKNLADTVGRKTLEVRHQQPLTNKKKDKKHATSLISLYKCTRNCREWWRPRDVRSQLLPADLNKYSRHPPFSAKPYCSNHRPQSFQWKPALRCVNCCF